MIWMEHSQPLDILFICVNMSNCSLYFLMRSGENVVSFVIPMELESICCCDLDSLVNIISGLKG